jgi:multiple sugar transport system substrate-binding protein
LWLWGSTGCFNASSNTSSSDKPDQPIRLLLVADPFSAALERMKHDMEAQFGTDVDVEIVVYNDMRTMALQNRQDLISEYDIISFDIVWLGEFVDKNILLPTPDSVNIDRTTFLQPALLTCTSGNNLYGFPIQPHAELLWARKDLLAEYNLPFPRTTVDVLSLARQLHNPEQQRYGIAWNAQRGQPLGQTMAHFFSAFGQPLLDENNLPAFNTPKGLAAARYAKALMDVSPPDILTMAWDQRTDRFASGQVVMTYGWGARAYEAETNPASTVRGQVAYGPAPHAPGTDPVTPLGVWAMGVPANVKNPERAFAVMEWLFALPQQRKLAEEGNGAPPYPELYAEKKLQTSYPVLAAMSDPELIKELDAGMRPSIPEWDALCEILGSEFHDMLLEKSTPEEALNSAYQKSLLLLTPPKLNP